MIYEHNERMHTVQEFQESGMVSYIASHLVEL